MLVLEASRARRVRIGALGALELEPGFYGYVGSARGPGGLAARIAHHRRRARAPRWHIDYLRRHTDLREVWGVASPAVWEHHFARAIAASESASTPLLGFGASDCRCSSHLFRFERRPRVTAFRRWLGSVRAGARGELHGPVRWR